MIQFKKPSFKNTKFEVNCEVDLLNDVAKYLILLQHL